jgi:hypothetical protein
MPRLIRVAMWCVLIAMLAQTDADPDLWGHVLGGRDIVAHGGVLRADPYSFTSDRAWVNHNWLGEVVLHEAWTHAGTAGLVLTKLLVACATLALVAGAVRAAGVPAPFAELLLFVWVAGVFPTTRTIRPQVFSLCLFALVLRVLGDERGGWRRLAGLPVVMALWANLHGGWVVGAAAIVPWALLAPRPAGGPSRAAMLGVAAASLLATLANPYGADLWRFLLGTLGGHADIGEWRSLADAGAARIAVWGVTALLAAAALVGTRRRPRLFAAVTVAALGIAAFRTVRLGAFFATAAVVLLAPEVAALCARRRAPTAGSGRAGAALGAAAAVVVLVAALAVGRSLRCLRVDAPWAPDLQAASLIRTLGLHGRMITWFDWGEYAMWHFGPQLQVSMDARRETVYSDATLAAHRMLYFAGDGAAAYLERLDADYVWVPRDLPLVGLLVPPRWHVVFRGERSVVAARRPRDAVASPAPEPVPRCFPADPLTPSAGVC